MATFLSTTDAGAVVRALVGQAQHDPAVAARLDAEFTSRQRALDRAVFLRARARGELAPGTDIEAAIDQLTGPVYYRVLVTGQAVPPAFTDAIVESFLAAGRAAARR